MPNDINSQTSEALEPPKDIEAEKAVLGSMMLSEDAVQDLSLIHIYLLKLLRLRCMTVFRYWAKL